MEPKQQADPDPADCPDLFSRSQLVERIVVTGEDPRQFQELYDQLYTQWLPRTVTEWVCFERILSAQWRLRRIDRMEDRLFTALGRILWAKGDDESLRRSLGLRQVREARSILKRVAGGRKMTADFLRSAERRFNQIRAEPGRERKRQAARLKAHARRKLADLKPGSNLIQ